MTAVGQLYHSRCRFSLRRRYETASHVGHCAGKDDNWGQDGELRRVSDWPVQLNLGVGMLSVS